jgi:hypothetical protein
MRKLIGACVLGATTLAGADGAAQEAAPAEQKAPAAQEEYTNEQIGKRVRLWYGWQTLLVDAAAFGTALAGYGTNDFNANPTSTIGIVGYIFGPPIVHWFHGHAGKGAIDLGARILGPLVLGGLGYLIGLPISDNASNVAGGIGLGIGYLGIVTVDAAVFAFEATYDTESARRASPKLFALPRIQLRPGGATAGFDGTF